MLELSNVLVVLVLKINVVFRVIPPMVGNIMVLVQEFVMPLVTSMVINYCINVDQVVNGYFKIL